MREELNEYLLALVLTAVLFWYTYVSIPRAPARPVRARPPEKRGGGGAASSADEVNELDWPEYLEEV